MPIRSQSITEAREAFTATRNLATEASIKAHLKATSNPESCPNLCWTPPPKGQDFTKIFRINLAPGKRPDRAMAPCPVCSPNSPRYYEGWLVWFPLEGVYRAIGRECAAHFIGHEQARAADREFETRTENSRNYAFAFDNMGNIPSMRRHLTGLFEICDAVEKLLRLLGRAHVKGIIHKAAKSNGGRLRLWSSIEVEREDLRTGEMKSVTEVLPEDLGTLRGWVVLGPNVHLVRDIRLELERLSHFDYGEGDDAQQWVLDHGEAFPDDLRIFRSSIIRAHDARRKALRLIDELRQFFTERNFELLARFGADARNQHPFYARYRNGDYRVGETSLNAMRLRPDLPSVDQLPPWPEIVQASD